MENSSAIILAAGEGKRMKSTTPKVLLKILEKPMIDFVLSACKEAEIKNKCVVVGNKAEQIKKHLKNEDLTFALQKNQKGTADAVKSATEFLNKNIDGDVFICCADSPLLDKETIINSYISHKKTNAAATTITAKVLNPQSLGRILRNEKGELIKIVEEKDANEKILKINEVNSGAYWFCVKDLLLVLEKITSKNSQNEYYLTDAIDLLIKKNKKVNSFITKNSSVVLGANTKLEIFKISQIIKNNIIEKLIEKGVEFYSTDGVLIYPEVKIEKNTKILPGSIIKGNTIIKENCLIGPNSLIQNSKIGKGCIINSSQVYFSEVEDFTTIGPFSHLRPNNKISHSVKIGNFVEIKNSKIDAGTAVSHLTYVGDCDVGKNVNFGCGSVTTNYDGVKKSRCTILDEAFIGCNTNLIAPVKLGKNSYTGAGSTITKNVPDNALAVERAKQINIKDFSKTKLANRKLKVKN